MPKTTDKPKPLPPPKRITVTLTPPVVAGLLDEQHRRRFAGESVSLADVVLGHLEQVYAATEGAR